MIQMENVFLMLL